MEDNAIRVVLVVVAESKKDQVPQFTTIGTSGGSF